VDAPTAVLSGFGQRVRGYGLLFGSTRPLPAGVLAARYPAGLTDFESAFDEATRRAADAGYLLDVDVAEILGLGRCAWEDDAGSSASR
jgi:hypothetical protein